MGAVGTLEVAAEVAASSEEVVVGSDAEEALGEEAVVVVVSALEEVAVFLHRVAGRHRLLRTAHQVSTDRGNLQRAKRDDDRLWHVKPFSFLVRVRLTSVSELFKGKSIYRKYR